MTKLAPIQLEDGTTIYIEATENAETLAVTTDEELDDELEESAVTKGPRTDTVKRRGMQSFKAVESTIRAYTNLTVNAFKQVAGANIDKVTLEFGIAIEQEGGIPYITKAKAEGNLKITVECSFPDRT